jgi:hypothetical protein
MFIEHTEALLGNLKPWPGNPRTHDDDLLDESVAAHGQYRAIITRRLPGGGLQIIAGHGTAAALLRSGETTARVEVHDLDDDTARQIVLVDNRTGDKAGYDERLLLALLDDAETAGGLLGTGWDSDAHRNLMDAVNEPTPSPKPPDDFPEYGDDIDTEYRCPSCGYEWSGKAHG